MHTRELGPILSREGEILEAANRDTSRGPTSHDSPEIRADSSF